MTHPIKTWRELTGTTQKALAEKIGVSAWHVKMIEAGNRKPSFELTRAISKYTKISRDLIRPDIYTKEK